MTERFFDRPPRGLASGVACLSLFVLLAVLVPAQPLAMERHWQEWMRDIQTPFLEHVALVFNYLGRGLGRALVIVAIGVVLLVARRWWALLGYAVAEALAPLFSSLTKVVVGRPRPPDGLVHPSGASFPSGHVVFAAVTLVSGVLLFTAPGPGRRLWWSFAAVGIAGMAWSRTYLQAHWLLDVAGGALLGAGVALVVFAALQLVAWAEPG
jgi:undecaprenyl-diphosphatase